MLSISLESDELGKFHSGLVSILASHCSQSTPKFIDRLDSYPVLIKKVKLLAISKVVGRILESYNKLSILIKCISDINQMSFLDLDSLSSSNIVVEIPLHIDDNLHQLFKIQIPLKLES